MGPTPEQFQNAWNEIVESPKVLVMTAQRRKALAARRRDELWCEHWLDALMRIKEKSFLRGENGRGWRANADWFLKPDSVYRIIEGAYDDGEVTRRTAADEFAERHGL